MQLLVQIFIVIVLLTIFWQDLRERAVSWVLFPLLTVLFIFYNSYYLNLDLQIRHFLMTFVFLFIQGGLLFLYFSFKDRKVVNVFKDRLGLGDVLFLLSTCFLFSLPNFIIFYMGSLVVILLIWIIILNFKNNREVTIPLAGLQSIILSTLFIIHIACSCFQFHNDVLNLNQLVNE